MITNQHVVQQLVADHGRELAAAAREARLRKAAGAVRRPTSPRFSWRRRAVVPTAGRPLTHQPATQIAR